MADFKFLTLADYVTPTVKESKKHNWVEYGDDNDFFQYVIDMYNSSPTNSACINGTADLIYGGGLKVVQSDKRLEGYVALKKIFKPNDVRNVCRDFKAFGMAAFELIKSKNRKKIVQAVQLPMNYLRAGVANNKGEIDEWYYSANWAEARKKGNKPEAIKAFGFEGNDERCVLVIKPYSMGNFYYNNPDYLGAIQWADVEGELSNFHLSNLKNGMIPGMMINFNNGVPTEEEQNNIEAKVKQKWGGSSNGGRFMVSFNRDKESAATVEPIQLSDAAEQFQTVSSEAMQKIMLGHRITSPMLLGIKDATGFGNNAEELQSAHALFINTVVNPMQEYILNAIDEVLHYNGFSLDIYFAPLTPLEFKSYDIAIDEDTQEKDTGVQMSRLRV